MPLPQHSVPAAVADRAGQLASAPAAWAPSLSPDGRTAAFVSDRDGTPALWVQELAAGGDPRRLPTGLEPVQAVSWSRDGAWIACLVAPGGGSLTEVWALRADGSALRRLAGGGGRAAFLGAWSHDGLLGLSETGRPGQADAYLVDPATGESRLVATGGLMSLADVTVDGRLALVRSGPRGRRRMDVVDVETGRRAPVLLPMEGSTDLGAFAPDGTVAYVRTDVGIDRAVLLGVRVEPADAERALETGAAAVLAQRDDAEVESFTVSEDGSTAVVLWNSSGRSELEVLDLTARPRIASRLSPSPPGDVVSGCSLSADGTTLLVAAEGPGQPSRIFALTLEGRSAWRDLGSVPVAEGMAVAEPELLHLRSRDGTRLSGWLHRASDGGTPGPVVVSLHGGPESQDRPGFNPLYAALVDAGISVFAPNVRGSSGFGRAFMEADNLDRRFGAIDDVAASVAHLVDRGVADPSRVACLGRSYGGYLTLASLVFHPQLFAAGVDICGMVDLETFYERTEPWIAAAAYPKYGHPERDRALLRALSPIHRMDQLRAPLLVVHGANDTNVPVYEAEQTVAAARARGVPVDLLLFDDEGHEVLTRANRMRFVRTTVAWLRERL